MNFVSHTNTLGVESKEIPCIPGKGAPTETTMGAVGCLYMDTDNGAMYKCTDVNDGMYTWVAVADADGGIYNKVVAEDYPVFNAILALFQKAIFKEDVTELIAKLINCMKRDVVQLENAIIINSANITREDNVLIIS